MSLPIKTLNEHHPDYDHDELEVLEALYEGGGEFHELRETLLPRNAQEPVDLYGERMRLTTYENHVGPIVDLIVAWLFSKPPIVSGFEPDSAPDWLENVDRRGTSLSMFARERVTEAMTYARDYTWVNLPAREVSVENRADEIRMGYHRPFLVGLEAEDVRDWGRDATGALGWIVTKAEVCTRSSIEQARTEESRWTWIDGVQIRRWVKVKVEGEKITDETQVEEKPPITHGFGRFPVAAIDLPAGLHVAGKLRDPVLGHVRVQNDHDWRLHRDAHNTMIIKSKDPAEPPTLGAGHYYQIGKDDDVFYAAPDSAIYTALAAREDAKREAIYRVVQQMAQGVSGKSTQQSASAAAKTLDWQSLQIMLAAYASHVRAWLRDVLRVAAVPLGVDPEGIQVGGLAGWQEADLAAILQDYLTATPLVKSETFRRLLAKEAARRMVPDGTPSDVRATIEGEIDAADYADAPLYAAPPLPGDAQAAA